MTMMTKILLYQQTHYRIFNKPTIYFRQVHLRWALLVIGTLLLTSCQFTGKPFTSPDKTPQPFSTTLVEYKRSGGIAGLDDHLIITDNGVITLTRRGKSFGNQLDTTQLQDLRQTLATARIEELNGEYLPAKSGADYMEYVVTYADHQVRAFDTAVPEALQPLLSLLNGIIKSTNKPTP